MSDLGPLSPEELELDQIRADIGLKRVQTQWEPWKTAATVVGAAAAVFTTFGVVIGYLLRGSVH